MKNVHLITKSITLEGVETKNIYITYSEKIKDGEYGLSRLGEIIKFHSGYDYRYYAKIILTTDQDLINDGVQGINGVMASDFRFLDWIFDHPNCEYVDIKKYMLCGYCGQENCHNLEHLDEEDVLLYEAIIPKEEAKQETLEESALRLYPIKIESCMEGKIDVNSYERNLFIEGAKWQKERMYSEEEVRKISLDFFYHWWNSKGTNTEQGFKEWFEQFKNK